MRSFVNCALVAVFLGVLSTGCAVGQRRDAAVEEVVEERRQLISAREAALSCRETSLAREAELLAIHARDLAAMRQSLQKLSDLTTHSAAIAARLQRAEVELEVAKREVAERQTQSHPSDADQFVKRLTPGAGDAAYREALRVVQSLVDSGKVRATVRNGRVTFVLPRQLDEVDPYSAPPGRRELHGFDISVE